MKICTGHYRYLLSIYHLGKACGRIRCVDVAADLGVSRASVSKMMKCMVRSGLVAPDYVDAISLTPEGQAFAEKLDENYDLTYAFFRRVLGLPPAQAKENAFLFLSDFPDETVRKLCRVTGRSLEQAQKKHPAHAVKDM